MFLTLLVVTFAVSALVSFLVARLFTGSLRRIMSRIVPEELSAAWHRYIIFAVYVVGISGGVRIYDLQQYIIPTPRGRDAAVLVLSADRWTFEVYRTVISTLQSVAWMLLVVFVFLLVAYVVIRGMEMRRAARTGNPVQGDTQ